MLDSSKVKGVSFKFLAVSTEAGAQTVKGGGETPFHEQPVLSHTALTPPRRGHHGVKPHENPEPSKETQAPSDGLDRGAHNPFPESC